MTNKIKVVGIGGTLREGSYSKAILHEINNLKTEDMDFEILDFSNFPLYNPDLEIPKDVKEFKDKIKNSDAIIFSIAEYNFSIPGSLKNAIDWASRPYGDNSWEGKPTGIISESTGMVGGSRAQYQLRQMMVYLNMFPINKPELIISNVKEKFDENHNLIDENTKKKIKELINSLIPFAKKLK